MGQSACGIEDFEGEVGKRKPSRTKAWTDLTKAVWPSESWTNCRRMSWWTCHLVEKFKKVIATINAVVAAWKKT
jgi:hypothetical protein